MKNYFIWAGAIIICIGLLYYINHKYNTEISMEEERNTEISMEEERNTEISMEEERNTEVSVEEERNTEVSVEELGVFYNRNYDEPRIQLTPSQLYSNYNSNSIRANMDFDGKLIELTGTPYKVDIAPDGDGVIYFTINYSNSIFIYAKGGKSFKADAANVSPGDTGGGIFLKKITLLCYSEDFSIDNPILTDCIFDHKTNSKREADRVAEARREADRVAEAQREAADRTSGNDDVEWEGPQPDYGD